MPDLSSDIRDYFDAVVESIDELQPLAPQVVGVETPRSRRGLWLTAGVVAAAFIAIVGIVIDRDDDQARVSTADESSASRAVTTFDELAPGWHQLDTGPVPPMVDASVAWTGTDLVVVGRELVGGYRAFAYTANTSTWRELPPIPDGQWPREGTPGLAWTGEELLVVEGSSPSRGAAVWDPDSNTWEEIDRPPVAAALQAIGQAGMRSSGPWGGPPALVWTGEAVLDLTNGAVWSPENRTWIELALPDNLIPYTGLIFTTPALVSDEVIAAPWSTSPGLAWNATGTTFRELPGMPPEIAEEGVTNDALTTSADGRAWLISGTDDGRTASFDPRTGIWRREADLFDASSEGCPIRIATVTYLVVARACWDQPSAALNPAGTQWEFIDNGGEACCDWLNATWIEADGVLISWSTSIDSFNDPDAPYVRAGVWVPPDSTPPHETPNTTAETLESLSRFLPPNEVPGVEVLRLEDGYSLTAAFGSQLCLRLRHDNQAGAICAAPAHLTSTLLGVTAAIGDRGGYFIPGAVGPDVIEIRATIAGSGDRSIPVVDHPSFDRLGFFLLHVAPSERLLDLTAIMSDGGEHPVMDSGRLASLGRFIEEGADSAR